jgi:Flp pilus assembly protein TadB
VRLALEVLALVAGERLAASRAAAIVASVADRLSFEERLGEEIRARTSGIRAQIVLLALLVPALSGYLVLTMPGLAITLASPLGAHVLVPLAILLEVAGIVASREIVRGIAT